MEGVGACDVNAFPGHGDCALQAAREAAVAVCVPVGLSTAGGDVSREMHGGSAWRVCGAGFSQSRSLPATAQVVGVDSRPHLAGCCGVEGVVKG